MSTNWSGAERKSRAPISLLDPETSAEDNTPERSLPPVT